MSRGPFFNTYSHTLQLLRPLDAGIFPDDNTVPILSAAMGAYGAKPVAAFRQGDDGGSISHSAEYGISINQSFCTGSAAGEHSCFHIKTFALKKTSADGNN